MKQVIYKSIFLNALSLLIFREKKQMFLFIVLLVFQEVELL